MLNTDVFSYVNVLNAAVGANETRNKLIANNIANSDTPGYKRQDIEFSNVLKEAMGEENSTASIDRKVKAALKHDLSGKIFTDHEENSYRLDGNNVDISTENVELASNQIEYQYLMKGINEEFKNLKMVMK